MKMGRRQFWTIVAVETACLVVLAVWLLSRLDRLFEPAALLVAAVIIAAGDVATVVIMERWAQPHVLLQPGGAEPLGRVVDDFDAAGEGLVTLRGERWRARQQGADRLRRGEAVRVVARQGLNLVVARLDDSIRG